MGVGVRACACIVDLHVYRIGQSCLHNLKLFTCVLVHDTIEHALQSIRCVGAILHPLPTHYLRIRETFAALSYGVKVRLGGKKNCI